LPIIFEVGIYSAGEYESSPMCISKTGADPR